MDDIVVFVPNKGKVVKISEGFGCNLSNKDYEDGYTEYVDVDIYDLPEIEEPEDGGIVMFKENERDAKTLVADTVKAVIRYLWDADDIPFQFLYGNPA